MAAPDHLLVLLDGRPIGVLTQRVRTGELRFEYDDAWRRDEEPSRCRLRCRWRSGSTLTSQSYACCTATSRTGGRLGKNSPRGIR